MSENIIYQLTKKYALRIIRLHAFLRYEKNEYVLSKQIYRSGTSIGANIAESLFAQSNADYINKLSIALKEASETKYWLELLVESGLLNNEQYESLLTDIKIIIGTLINIINKLKDKDRKSKKQDMSK